MSSYWVNFATTGDPNGKGLPVWPVFDPKADVLMEFGDKVGVEPIPHKPALDFLDDFIQKQRKSIPVK